MQYYRNGNGYLVPAAGMGQIDILAKGIADDIVKAILPSLKPIVAEAAQAAEPTISTVVKRDIVPWVFVGIVAMGAVAAGIGAFVATQRRRTTPRRRNPRRRYRRR